MGAGRKNELGEVVGCRVTDLVFFRFFVFRSELGPVVRLTTAVWTWWFFLFFATAQQSEADWHTFPSCFQDRGRVAGGSRWSALSY